MNKETVFCLVQFKKEDESQKNVQRKCSRNMDDGYNFAKKLHFNEESWLQKFERGQWDGMVNISKAK